MTITMYKIWPTIYTGGNYGYTLYRPADPETIWETVTCDLPDGYTLDRNQYDQLMIFDPDNRGCDLRGDKTGERVRLISDHYSVTVPTRDAQAALLMQSIDRQIADAQRDDLSVDDIIANRFCWLTRTQEARQWTI